MNVFLASLERYTEKKLNELICYIKYEEAARLVNREISKELKCNIERLSYQVEKYEIAIGMLTELDARRPRF